MSNLKDKAKLFKQELKDLLEKHSATIDFECSSCSDLHGVYDAKMAVTFWEKGTYGESVALSEGYGVSKGDL